MGVWGNWRDRTTYQYTLAQPASAWSWEFLRRHQGYQAAAEAARGTDPASAAAQAALWGLRAFEDPTRSGADTLVFWLPDLLPAYVRFVPARGRAGGVDPWAGTLRRSVLKFDGGYEVAVAHGTVERRFWVDTARPPKPGMTLLALVGFRDRIEPQFRAIRRFQHSITHPQSAETVTPYQRQSLCRILQALDGSLDGASTPVIAEAVFGTERMRRDWYRGSPLRDQVRYLVRRGRALMDGKYRGLLKGQA